VHHDFQLAVVDAATEMRGRGVDEGVDISPGRR
jgi:hypothetical protein